MPALKDERVYKSKAGFFHVFELNSTYAVYNNSGIRVATVASPKNRRGLRMAELIADAIETEFQY